MKRVIYTSAHFTGDIEFRFGSGDRLCYFEIRAELTDDQHGHVLNMLPLCFDDLRHFQKHASGKLDVIMEKVTFEMFWNYYGKKVNRLRCEKLWDKITEGQQRLCYSSLRSYLNCLERTRRYKQDPETYLRNQNWNTNWDQIH